MLCCASTLRCLCGLGLPMQSHVHQQLEIYEFIRDTGLRAKNRIGTDVSASTCSGHTHRQADGNVVDGGSFSLCVFCAVLFPPV